MLDSTTKKRIDDIRDILVGKVTNPIQQVEQITVALIYKFMDDMDMESVELGGERKFFSHEYEKFAWSKLFKSDIGGEDRVELYSEALVKMELNPYIPQLFRNIFKRAFLPYRDPETLRNFLKYINDFTYSHSEKLGDAFEYLLSILGSQGDAGQFRTPRHIIEFMAALVDPQKGETILDPACGTAGFLISAYKHILKSNSSNYDAEKDKHLFDTQDLSVEEISVNGKLYKGDKLTPDERNQLTQNVHGYDISPDMVRLSLVNMYLHGFPEPHIYEYDTLTSDDRWNEFYDIILANPPFMSPKGGIRPHKRFSVQSKRSEVLFVDYMAEHLTATGRAAIVVPEGIIFQTGTAYKNLRKMLVDENYLVGVISLPAGVFQPYAGVKTSILWLDKKLARKTDNILFAKITNDGFDLGAQRRPVKQNDLPEAFGKLTEYRNALQHDDAISFKNDPIVSLVSKSEIKGNGDYGLSGERYKKAQQVNSNYEFVKIGEIFKTSSGGTPSKNNENYWKEGTIPWLKSGEVAQGLIYQSDDYITEDALKESSAKIFPINSVLIAMYGATTGQVGLLKFEATTNQAVCAIYPNEKAIPEFLYYLLKSKREYLVGLSVGGAQPNISQTIIKDIQIPLPPLSVQEEIVAEIEGYQKIIDGARQVVDNYKPHIDIDPDWEIVELGELALKITDGTHRTPKYTDDGIPFLRVTDITKSNLTKKFISHKEHKELIKRCNPEKGDILYSKNGTIGVAKKVDWDYEFSIFVSLALIKPKSELIDSSYLEVLMNTQFIFNQAIAHSKSGTVTNLHLVEIKQFKIPLPSIQIQQQIVTRIEQEQQLVAANKQLIEIYEQKIKERIGKVWGL